MNVKLVELLTSGVLGPFRVGTPWEDVESVLGPPPLFAPPAGSSRAIARYGDLQFTVEEGAVAVIGLFLREANLELPEAIAIVDMREARLFDIDEVEGLLAREGISWEPIEMLSDEWSTYFRTSRGVHITFGGGRLAAIAAADPRSKWGA